MKYAMVPINFKYDTSGRLLIRRVLIAYLSESVTDDVKVYNHTRLIAVDPYFKDPSKSHQYVFTDSTYQLVSNNYSENLLHGERAYHTFPWCQSIEFDAADDDVAIVTFNEREELAYERV